MVNLPLPVLTVAGENAFHTIVSQMFVAINREILQQNNNKTVIEPIATLVEYQIAYKK